MAKLVGYARFTSKKGDDYCVARVVKDFNKRALESGAVGQDVESIFMPREQYNLLKPADIGKELKFEYELSGGRAYLVHVSVVG
ncbi:MAG: hypothetical protein LUE31_00905 [Lachnospiraceae bacterium]|nr:hypothetical protein [Lachnospiraceae bacterium]